MNDTTTNVSSNQRSPSAFACTVENDSMVASEGEFTFPPGCSIIVEPEATPKNADFVVAELPGGTLTFGELVIDGNRRYLKPLNPHYPVLDGNDAQIIGVVVSRVMTIRQWQQTPAASAKASQQAGGGL